MSRRRKKSKKWIYWLFFLALSISAGVVCYLVWDNYFDKKKEDVVNVENTEIEQLNESELEKNEEDIIASDEEDERKVTQYEGEDPNVAAELSGVITYAGVQSDKLMIRVNIDQYLDNGKCELILKRGNDTIYNSIASIIGSASTATCEGFDVPTSGLGGGNTEIIINLSANEKAGTIRGEVNL